MFESAEEANRLLEDLCASPQPIWSCAIRSIQLVFFFVIVIDILNSFILIYGTSQLLSLMTTYFRLLDTI